MSEVLIRTELMEVSLEMSRSSARQVMLLAMELAEKDQIVVAQEDAPAERKTEDSRPHSSSTALSAPAGGDAPGDGNEKKPASRVERMFGSRESWGSGEGPGGIAPKGPSTPQSACPADSSPYTEEPRRLAPMRSAGDSAPYGGKWEKEAPVGEDDGITMADAVKKLGRKEKAWNGFLYLQCSCCGEIRGLAAKKPVQDYRCRCGGCTALRALRKLKYTCVCCGKTWEYRTNVAATEFEMECLQCKAPNNIYFNARRQRYEGMR